MSLSSFIITQDSGKGFNNQGVIVQRVSLERGSSLIRANSHVFLKIRENPPLSGKISVPMKPVDVIQ
jgi:hypothetical protein